MRRELRGLRKMKQSKVNSELNAIDKEIQKVNIQDNLLSFLKNDFESQMQNNMQEIEETEAVLDHERTALKAHADQERIQIQRRRVAEAEQRKQEKIAERLLEKEMRVL